MVRAKMHCHSNTGVAAVDVEKRTSSSASIRLGAVYESFPSEEARAASENAVFGLFTPYGEVNLGIANPDAAAFFKPGKKYYVDFTEATD